MASATARSVVLLVEDNPSWREILELTLEPLDLDLRNAANLAEARRQLDPPPDLVVLDFYLTPEVGTDLIEDIPEGVPILLLTGSIDIKELERKYPRLTTIMRKPIGESELRTTIQSLLQGS